MRAVPAWRRRRGVSVATAAAIVLVSLTCSAAAAPTATAVWGVALKAQQDKPSASELASLRKSGLNALVVDRAAVTSAERSRLAATSRRAGLLLLLPRRSAPGSLAAVCRADRRGPSRNCAVSAASPKAAVVLARRNVADYVVIRLSTLGQLRFLQGVTTKTRILAVARASARTLDRKAWSRAVTTAAKDPALDLAIAVSSPAQPSLKTYTALVRTARRAGDKTALTADTKPPSVPQGLQATSSSRTAVSIAWNAASDNVGVTGYRLYRNNTLVGSTASRSYAFSGLSCGTTYAFGVQAVDAAGNGSFRPESVLTAATSACSGPPPPPPPPPLPTPPSLPVAGMANVWVDLNGGSCVRPVTAVAYIDATACGSFDAAYDRAAPGDVIEIVGGTYPRQALTGDKGSTTRVVLRTAAGQNVVVNGNLDISADYASVIGPMTITAGVDIDANGQSNPINGVQISGVKARSSFIENTHDLTIKNSELGPNPGEILMQIGALPETQRLTLDNVYLHDNPPTSGDQHVECIFSTGIQGLTIRNSRFQNCGYFILLSGMCCSAPREPSSFVFENNTFGQTKCVPNAGGCPASGNAPVSLMLSRPVGGQSRIVGNHFTSAPALTGSFQQLTASGNTGAVPASWR